MKKRMVLTLVLALGILSAALLPSHTFADTGKPRNSLASIHVPANQSRHLEFTVPTTDKNTSAASAGYYTVDIDNRSSGPTAPDSGYLNGACTGVIKHTGYGGLIWQLTLTTRFQYDGFQSVRRVGLSSSAVGYGGWRNTFHHFNWAPTGSSWLESFADADFNYLWATWSAYVDAIADSEGNCDTTVGEFVR